MRVEAEGEEGVGSCLEESWANSRRNMSQTLAQTREETQTKSACQISTNDDNQTASRSPKNGEAIEG